MLLELKSEKNKKQLMQGIELKIALRLNKTINSFGRDHRKNIILIFFSHFRIRRYFKYEILTFLEFILVKFIIN